MITPSAAFERVRVEDPHKVATEILSTALDDGEFERSLSNCHVAGVDSIVLYDHLDTGGGMVRFFWTERGNHNLAEIHNARGHFNLGIHNHKYDLAIVPLVGCINNVETRVLDRYTFGSEVLHEYEFTSAIVDDDAGPVRVVHKGSRYTEKLDLRHLTPGVAHQMSAEDLHTVHVLDTSAVTAWMVIEGVPVDTVSKIYSPRPDLTISSDELYRPMSRDDAWRITEKVLNVAVKG